MTESLCFFVGDGAFLGGIGEPDHLLCDGIRGLRVRGIRQGTAVLGGSDGAEELVCGLLFR